MDKIEMQRAMAVAPETANGTSPAASPSRKQRSGKAAPHRANHSSPAVRGSAKYRHAPEGPDAQPAAASAKRRSSRKSQEQQASQASPDTAKGSAPAWQGYAAVGGSPEMDKEAAPQTPAFICAELVALQRRRRFSIKMQSRIDRGLEAALARQIGFRTDLPPAERLRLFRRVAVMRKAIIDGDQLADLSHFEWSVATEWRYEIALTEQARGGWDYQRDAVEHRMRGYAEQLPAWQWAQGIRGFTSLGLAVIVGEACGPAAPELGDFRSHQNLCKRLAIGVVDGHRQGSPGTGATPDDWIREGYKRERRAEIWTILDFSLRNAQWRTESGPLGSYGAIYGRQSIEYERREWKHAKKAAARYMAKCFIRDLWRAWRRYHNYTDGALAAPPQGQQCVAPVSEIQQVASTRSPNQARRSAPTAVDNFGAMSCPPQGHDVVAPKQQGAISEAPNRADSFAPPAVPNVGAALTSPQGHGKHAPMQQEAKAGEPMQAMVPSPPVALEPADEAVMPTPKGQMQCASSSSTQRVAATAAPETAMVLSQPAAESIA